MQCEPLRFEEVRETHPDRYRKGSLLDDVDRTDDGFVVSREDSESGHHCLLALVGGEPFGYCSCKGYKHHDGPCSHLCLLWRGYANEMLDLPPIRLGSISLEVLDPDEERAQNVDGKHRQEVPG